MQIIDLQSNNVRYPTVKESGRQLWTSQKPLKLEASGIELPFQLAYQTWGKLNKTGDNAVLVVHALSGSANLESWWPDLLGSNKPLNPERDFVICINLLGSCYGSSGPASIQPNSNELWKIDFPQLSIRDQVCAQATLIRHLGINKLRCIIGPSLGGMIALEWALLEPELVSSLILIATTAQHSAQAIAHSSCQRTAIRLDPNFNNGYYLAHQAPENGLALARQMAFITYRSDREFSERFQRLPGEHQAFAVQDYLLHQGHKFTERFDANCYIRLSECMNSHDIGKNRNGVISALQSIQQPTLVISLEHDQLYTYAEQALLAEHIPNATHQLINTRYGHDGFLIESQAMATILSPFLDHSLRQ
jgi:homoserine O-acetyltransferase/O-succinyltransferase